MNPKDLSKQKYIYKLYQAVNGLLHVEKYPIVYANKEHVYYKTCSGGELQHIKFRSIADTIDDMLNGYTDRRLMYGIYCWTDPKDCSETIKELKKNNLKKRIWQHHSWIYSRQRELDRLISEAEKLKKELEALNETE